MIDNLSFRITQDNTLMGTIEGEVFSITGDNYRFKEAVEAIQKGDKGKLLEAIAKPVEMIERFLSDTKGELFLDKELGVIKDLDTGEVLPSAQSSIVIRMAKAGLPVEHYMKFLKNLRDNPSFHAQQELNLWLDKANMPITTDGCFLAWKKVNRDFTSIHDGKTKNDVGTTVEMPRGSVDDDRRRTCSYGLHFCSMDYLPCFGGSNQDFHRIILVKINPVDVVAIPEDYNFTKGRTCKYEVLKDVTTQFYGEDYAKFLEGIPMTTSDGEVSNETLNMEVPTDEEVKSTVQGFLEALFQMGNSKEAQQRANLQ